MRRRITWVAGLGLLAVATLTGCATNYPATTTNDAGEPYMSASPPWTWPYTDPSMAYPGRPSFPPHTEGP